MNKINKINLSGQTKFRLSEIIGIENSFHQEINQRKSCSKKLSICYRFWLYRQDLIILSATSSGVCIILFESVVGAPARTASASFTLIFCLTTGIIKKLLSITKNKKKKHDKILMLAKSKLNSIETLVSQALTDMEINHEKFNWLLGRNKNMVGWKKMGRMSVKNKKIWVWIVWIQKK